MEGIEARARPHIRRHWIARAGVLAGLLAVAYAGLIGYLLANERALIFRPRRTAALLASSLELEPASVALTTSTGDRTVAWQIRARPPSPHWVLYLHGNDATIRSGANQQRYHQLRSLGLNVLAPEYPGYGNVAGEPSENGLRRAARTAYDYLRRDLHVDASNIVIYGWSLGTGGAVPLARDVDEAALVVEGAFSSVLRRAQAAYPFLPISLMVSHTFLSEDAIADTRSPTLFLHSPDDTVIPFADGQRLHARAREPKQLVPLRGGHVTPNLDDEDRYMAAIHGFLRRHLQWQLKTPGRSMGLAVRDVLAREGIAAALAACDRFRQEGTPAWNVAEYELEHLGRSLLDDEQFDAAVQVLHANARAFPSSPLAQFHLAIALRETGDVESARRALERSLVLDRSPSNSSHAALATLR